MTHGERKQHRSALPGTLVPGLLTRRWFVDISWIPSATVLPTRGTHIQFFVDRREVPLNGSFADGVFQSRWAGYEVERVKLWRTSTTAAGVI